MYNKKHWLVDSDWLNEHKGRIWWKPIPYLLPFPAFSSPYSFRVSLKEEPPFTCYLPFSPEHTWWSLSDSLAASCCGGKLFSVFIIPGTFSCWNYITIYLAVIWLEITSTTMMAKALGKAPTIPSNLAQTISTQYRFVDGWTNEKKLLNSCKGVLGAHVYKTVYRSVPELNVPQFDLLNKKGQSINQGKCVFLKFSPKLAKVSKESWLCVDTQFLRSVIPVPSLARRVCPT